MASPFLANTGALSDSVRLLLEIALLKVSGLLAMLSFLC